LGARDRFGARRFDLRELLGSPHEPRLPLLIHGARLRRRWSGDCRQRRWRSLDADRQAAHTSEPDDIPAREHGRAVDALAVHERSVGRTGVLQQEVVAFAEYARMPARDALDRDPDVVLARSAEPHAVGQHEVLTGDGARATDESRHPYKLRTSRTIDGGW